MFFSCVFCMTMNQTKHSLYTFLFLALFSFLNTKVIAQEEKDGRKSFTPASADELLEFAKFSNGTSLAPGAWINTDRKDLYMDRSAFYLLLMLHPEQPGCMELISRVNAAKEEFRELQAFMVFPAFVYPEYSIEDLEHLLNKHHLDLPLYRAVGSIPKKSNLDYSPEGHHYFIRGDFRISNKYEGYTMGNKELGEITEMIELERKGRQKPRKMSNKKLLSTSLESRPQGILNYPVAIAADGASGKIWLWSSKDRQILQIDMNGEINAVIGSGKSGLKDGSLEKVQLGAFGRMDFDPKSGRLYILDSENSSLRVADTLNLSIKTLLGNGQIAPSPMPDDFDPKQDSSLANPGDIKVSDGRVLIAMTNDHSIWEYDPAGNKMKRIFGRGVEGFEDGKTKKAGMAYPVSIARDKDGNLYFTEGISRRLRRYDGKRIETLSDSLPEQVGHKLFIQGNILHAVFEGGQGIWKFTEVGDWEQVVGKDEAGFMDGGTRMARFRYPVDVTQANGLYYIADAGNQCIRSWDPDGKSVATLPVTVASELMEIRLKNKGLNDMEVMESTPLSKGENIVQVLLQMPSGVKVLEDKGADLRLMDKEYDELISSSLSDGEIVFKSEGAEDNIHLTFILSFYYELEDRPGIIHHHSSRVLVPFHAEDGEEAEGNTHTVLYTPLVFD